MPPLSLPQGLRHEKKPFGVLEEEDYILLPLTKTVVLQRRPTQRQQPNVRIIDGYDQIRGQGYDEGPTFCATPIHDSSEASQNTRLIRPHSIFK